VPRKGMELAYLRRRRMRLLSSVDNASTFDIAPDIRRHAGASSLQVKIASSSTQVSRMPPSGERLIEPELSR
jgi:hypothetical protein